MKPRTVIITLEVTSDAPLATLKEFVKREFSWDGFYVDGLEEDYLFKIEQIRTQVAQPPKGEKPSRLGPPEDFTKYVGKRDPNTTVKLKKSKYAFEKVRGG